MSMAPQLSCSRSRRDRLSNLRNTFTYISQLFVLGCASLIFAVFSNKSALFQFRLLSYLAVGVGTAACIMFICTVNEPKLSRDMKTCSKYLSKKEEEEK